MNTIPRITHVLPHWLNWFIFGISSVSTLLGGVILVIGENTIHIGNRAVVHYFPQPAAIINFVIAIFALIVTMSINWRKSQSLPAFWLPFIVAIMLGAGFSSLLFRDDYFADGCGEYDMRSGLLIWGYPNSVEGNLHAGYPYSWLDGRVCVPYQQVSSEFNQYMSLNKYAVQHPERAKWYLDFPALVVDLFFWGNVGIVLSWTAGILMGVRHRRIKSQN